MRGLSFRLLENFFRFLFSAASALKLRFTCGICKWWWCSFLLLLWGLLRWLLCCCRSFGGDKWCWSLDCRDEPCEWLAWRCLLCGAWWFSPSGLSKLGFESVGDSVTASSEFGLLLADSLRWWRRWWWLLGGGELHTESSDRERPMKRDTLPDFAASMSVPASCGIWELEVTAVRPRHRESYGIIAIFCNKI